LREAVEGIPDHFPQFVLHPPCADRVQKCAHLQRQLPCQPGQVALHLVEVAAQVCDDFVAWQEVAAGDRVLQLQLLRLQALHLAVVAQLDLHQRHAVRAVAGRLLARELPPPEHFGQRPPAGTHLRAALLGPCA
jgi:hypothetical protein